MEMVCPECKKIGEKSQLVKIFYGNGAAGNVNSFFDEDGASHYHDPNPSIAVLRCSSGHEITHVSYHVCHTCRKAEGEDRFEIMDGFGFL